MRAGVKAAGGDPKSVKYIEVPFPDMPAALADHRIEAGWMVEPFVTIARSRGDKVVDWPFVAIAPKVMIAVYFASVQYANANPDMVKRFKAAITESLAYADSHADEVRQIIPTYTRITPEIAAKITLPIWPTEINRASTQAMADDALEERADHQEGGRRRAVALSSGMQRHNDQRAGQAQRPARLFGCRALRGLIGFAALLEIVPRIRAHLAGLPAAVQHDRGGAVQGDDDARRSGRR